MTSPNQALKLAIQLHAGQTDKAGAPYWEHCMRVQQRCAQLPSLSSSALVAAALHDVVEDGKASFDELLLVYNLEPREVKLIEILTRKAGEDYDAYIDRIIHSGTEAWAIKMADLADNLDPLRLYCLPTELRKRLYFKYNTAVRMFLQLP